MKKSLFLSVLFITAGFTFLLTSSRPAMAATTCPPGQTLKNNQCCQEISIGIDDGTGQTTNCVPAGGQAINDNPIVIFLRAVLQFFAVGVGLLVTGGIITGGILYMTARGNAAQVEKAQEVIRNSVIGLLLFLGLFAIINFMIPGGILV
ncbi:MAG TPA: hypothetical protein VFT87_01640 [Candidatus Saccharimonadales bacterium]|nr:hypothetical protein [Candidatus Saccharimonadales bacterium]